MFTKLNLDQNDLDLEIPCFAVQDLVTHLTFVLVFQSKIGIGSSWSRYTLFQISKSGLLVLYGAPKGTWWWRGGGGCQCFAFQFCIAFTQITTSDCAISYDCANVVYNQWLKKIIIIKYYIFLWYWQLLGDLGIYYILQMLYFLDQFY